MLMSLSEVAVIAPGLELLPIIYCNELFLSVPFHSRYPEPAYTP